MFIIIFFEIKSPTLYICGTYYYPPYGGGAGGGAFYLILLILQIRICRKVGRRNRIKVVLIVYSHSVLCAALPFPHIRRCGELAEADKVGTAIALHIEFTGTLVDDELLVELTLLDIAALVAIGTLAKSVNIAECLLARTTIASRTTASAYIR